MYNIILLSILLIVLLYVRKEQSHGSRKSELDDTGTSDDIRMSGTVQITAYIASYLKNSKNYFFTDEHDIMNAIRKRIHTEVCPTIPNATDIYYVPNRKKVREFMFTARIKARRQLWRYYTHVEFIVK